jgi:hypothetical protein
MLKHILTFIALVICFASAKAQELKENWVAVSTSASETLFINVTGISIFSGDDICVWTLLESKTPTNMDGIDGDIYKTKTYYLINKTLRRYSISEVMYFDEQNNILKTYSYNHNTDNSEFKYSTPILHGSDIEQILLKCLEYIPSTSKTEN